MMAQGTLHIRLLGGLDLRLDDAPLPPMEWARAESLLAYLVLHADAPLLRRRLAFLLWPDSDEQQARTNLRHALHTLRRALPEPDRYVEATPRTLRWRVDTPFCLDVAAFEGAIRAAEDASDDDAIAVLREAVHGYGGDLLDGRYDEWLLEERERLRQRYLYALETLATLLEARGDHAEAVRHGEQLLAREPLREQTYRLLMRLHHARGDRARALRTYHECATTLERELGVEPSEATRAAYDALLPPEPASPGVERAPGPVRGPPLVGRGTELTRLTTLWRETERGHAHLALVTGEPGIGKTRMIEELRTWCAHRSALTVEARSYRVEGAPAYGPIVAWLRREAIKERFDRLDEPLLTELARLLPELLSERPALPRPEPLSENEQRQRLFDAVASALLVPGSPVLLVADDLHWADPQTLQVIHYLLRAERQVPLMVAATARREELDDHHPLLGLVAALQALERCTEIDLGRLSAMETGALAERIGGAPLPPADAARLFAATEGNPLFVVETMRAGWRPRDGQPAGMAPRVQATISARLGQLSDSARHLAGVAATIGRAFTADALTHASGAEEATLVRSLDELWRRGIIREQGDGYDFTHDKIREVAYGALSPAVRRGHHRAVARALERDRLRDPGLVSAQVATHYEAAGAVDDAVGWYVGAAEAAQQLHAHAEAARLLRRALDLLGTLPSTPQRQTKELATGTALLAPLVAIDGMASERVTEVQRSMLELARALRVEPAPPLLRSLALAGLARDDFVAARAFGDQLRALAERDGDDVLAVEGHYVLGVSAFWQGELDTARAHLESAVRRYLPERSRIHLLRYGQDPRATCLMRLALTLWLMGRPEAALRARAAALEWADKVGHPYTTMVALVFASYLTIALRDPETLREHAATLTAIAAHHGGGAPQIQTAIDALGGYVMVLDGQADAGIARIRSAWDDMSDSEPAAPGIHASTGRVLVEACAAARDPLAGLAAAERALDRQGAARVWEAEFRRLRAEFLAVLGGSTEDVEAELRRALDVARLQGAHALELRAAVTLVQRRLEGPDAAAVRQARDGLAAIVEAAPERGATTPDLDVAAALLR